MNVTIIRTEHVGLTTGAALAYLEQDVTGVDTTISERNKTIVHAYLGSIVYGGSTKEESSMQFRRSLYVAGDLDFGATSPPRTCADPAWFRFRCRTIGTQPRQRSADHMWRRET